MPSPKPFTYTFPSFEEALVVMRFRQAEAAHAKAASRSNERKAVSLPTSLFGGILRREVLDQMGRRRYQHPDIFKTKTARPRWFFRAVADTLVDRGRTGRIEKRVYLGYCDEQGRREAEKARDERLKEINNAPAVLQSQVRFNDLVEVYKSTYLPGLKPSTAYNFACRLKRYIEPTFGAMRLHEIDSIKVQQWIYQMQDSELSPGTRKTNLAILRSVFEAAAFYGYTQARNPCDRRINIGSEGDVRDGRPLEPQEAKRLLDELDEEPLKLIFEIALYTGARVSEVLGATWGAIDIRNRLLHVRQGKSQRGELAQPKTKAGRRTVHLGFLAGRFTRPERAKDDDLVWPDEIYHVLQGKLRTRAKRAGIEFDGFGFHTARRTYSTLRDALGLAGPSAEHVRDMGHTSASMTARYTRRNEADLPDRLRRLIYTLVPESTYFSAVSRQKKTKNRVVSITCKATA